MRRVSPAVAALVALVSGCAETGDPGDLRAEAQMIVQAARETERGLTLADVLGPAEGPVAVPQVIRVWRRGLDGSTSSCQGRVDVLELDTYVSGVLPHEWMSSWEDESLDVGAIAARTYASFWAAAGGRYQCADVDDTTWSQVYKDARSRRADEAVARTAGAVAVRDDSLLMAEYSAENGGRTDFGVDDPPCAHKAVEGHGRGVCQWGTQRWAQQGKDAAWMIAHYYPGARVAWADEALVDGIDLTVRAGQRFSLELAVTNPGPEPWEPGFVTVGTDPSAFTDPTWTDTTRPAAHEEGVDAGQTAHVRWWMTAPDVTEPTTFAEFFWLEGPDPDRPGTSGSWRILVEPAPAEAPPAPEPPAWRRDLGRGAAIGVVLVAAAVSAGLVHRRRRARAPAAWTGGTVIRPKGPRPPG